MQRYYFLRIFIKIKNIKYKFGNEFGVKFGVNEKKVLLLLNENPSLSASELHYIWRFGIFFVSLQQDIQ